MSMIHPRPDLVASCRVSDQPVWIVWAHNDRAGRWLPIGMHPTAEAAEVDVAQRRSVISRLKYRTEFVALPQGEEPES